MVVGVAADVLIHYSASAVLAKLPATPTRFTLFYVLVLQMYESKFTLCSQLQYADELFSDLFSV